MRKKITYKKRIGNIGEAIVANKLIQKGFTIIDRNYFCKGHKGEIDIVAIKDNKAYFFEVRTRSSNLSNGEYAVINSYKKYKFLMACYCWINEHNYQFGGIYLAIVKIIVDDTFIFCKRMI